MDRYYTIKRRDRGKFIALQAGAGTKVRKTQKIIDLLDLTPIDYDIYNLKQLRSLGEAFMKQYIRNDIGNIYASLWRISFW
ncbi:MAG: hypothetical protein GY702_08950 [Desulfobulbaceae bacterium]|nr:hypothetical protein [Desulfobulbaceae bacterium]